MRTTVTLDPDAEQIIRERMAQDQVSFKHALNDAIRESMSARGPRTTFVTRAVPMGHPTVSLDHALQFAADLEDEELVRKMRRGA